MKKHHKPKHHPRSIAIPSPSDEPTLRFTPYAWAKLQWFCHHGETEIAGFATPPGTPAPGTPGSPSPGNIKSDSIDELPGESLLLVEDFVTIRQQNTMASVSFDDEAVADFFDQQVDLGRKPEQFSRIWLHTHPGESPEPSGTDEQTFERVFGACDWAVMFILAENGDTYARLRFNVGPGGECLLNVGLDCSQPFPEANLQLWEAEYQANIHEVEYASQCLGRDQLPANRLWLDEFELNNVEDWDEIALQALAMEADEDLFEDEDENLL